MYLRTKKQELYFAKVIQLRYEKGYGPERISRILPIGHATVSRWISIFAAENAVKSVKMRKPNLPTQSAPVSGGENDIEALRKELSRLQFQLNHEQLRADAYEEMINVAETKFNIAIRKKAGAKR